MVQKSYLALLLLGTLVSPVSHATQSDTVGNTHQSELTFNKHISTPIEAFSDLIYLSRDGAQQSLEFALPTHITPNQILSVTSAKSSIKIKDWRATEHKLIVTPDPKWQGTTLIEMRLKNGVTKDYVVTIYSGKFELSEKSEGFIERQNKLTGLQRYVMAGYTASANAPIEVPLAGSRSPNVAQVRVNGEPLEQFTPQHNHIAIEPHDAWRVGLNQIEIVLSGEQTPYLYLLNYQPKATQVHYSMSESSVNGKAFLPRAIYGVNKDDFAQVADFGFNIVHSYQLRKMTPQQRSDYMQTARQHNLMVFSHIDEQALLDGDVVKFAQRITQSMAEPNLFAWYFWDEPSPNELPADYYQFFTDLTRKLDPYRPIIASHWYQRYYQRSGEIDMRQFYQGQVPRMTSAFASYKRIMAQTDSPWLAIVNTHEGYKPKNMLGISPKKTLMETVDRATTAEEKAILQRQANQRYKAIKADLANPPYPIPSTLPQTRHQIRGQAFSSITQGSNGIFYWLYGDAHRLGKQGWYTLFHLPEPASYMKELMHDLALLEPYIAAPNHGSVTWKQNGIRIWSKSHGGNQIIIAVNETNRQLKTQIDLSPLNVNIPERLVRFGHLQERSIAVNQQRIEDSWLVNQAHVYLINPL